MTPAITVAAALVRTWTHAYTSGVPSVWAQQRRAEIESDLWEFEHDPDGTRGLAPAVQVLGRLCIGIVDDVRWRVERTTFHDNVLIRRAVTLAAATVTLSMLWGASGDTSWIARCPSVPRKPRIDQVVACVGAFFASHPRSDVQR